jgi:hypothetical protein
MNRCEVNYKYLGVIPILLVYDMFLTKMTKVRWVVTSDMIRTPESRPDLAIILFDQVIAKDLCGFLVYLNNIKDL